MVGPNGLEPSTSSVSGKRSNQLSYGPIASHEFIREHLGTEAAQRSTAFPRESRRQPFVAPS
jgi:hypothetical protein